MCIVVAVPTHALQFNLRRAAKERIRRMVAPKSTKKHLNAPDYVVEEFKNGDKDALADLLQRVNWSKDWFINNVVY